MDQTQPHPRLASCAWKRKSGRRLECNSAGASQFPEKDQEAVASNQIRRERLCTRSEAAQKNTLPCYQQIAVVIVNCNLGPTEHLGVHSNLLKRVRALLIELEFGSVGF